MSNDLPGYMRNKLTPVLHAVDNHMQHAPQQQAPGPEHYAKPQYEAVHPLNATVRLVDSLRYRHMREWGTELVTLAKARGFVIKMEDGSYRDPLWNDFAELLFLWSEAPPPQPTPAE